MESCQVLDSCEYLNIGCGALRYKNCINMDIAKNDKIDADILGDVRKIPFDKNRFKGVILSHVLEHLHDEEHKQALFEIRRVLKDNGTVYIEVPDFELVLKYYLENHKGRRKYWYHAIYGRGMYEEDYHRSGITKMYLTDLLFECGFYNLQWATLPIDEALIGVVATKGELP